ncbi:MAG: IS30 family transposase [Selenomonadaceae bacterium]|nr:IS30 family transposase [Selenomonadaceae bacterium]
MSYKHLSITEREKILFHLAQGLSICQIAKILGRNKSTISRELKRNSSEYLPSKAQANYHKRRKKSCRHKLLAKPELFALVKKLFLELRWSPEQIAARLKLENYPIQISSKTIYRAIYAGMFDTTEQHRSKGNRRAIRHLRHRGKSRHSKNYEEKRGKFPISNELSARPAVANERTRFGDFEADTILGQPGKACLLTLVDRKSRFLISRLLAKKNSTLVAQAIVDALKNETVYSITPDRGKEFSKHAQITTATGFDFYFPLPHQPWQRGTNENTNGLLREFFPKSYDFNKLNDADLQVVVDQLNQRPKKCLGYRTPWEIYFSTSLHFT